MALGRYGWPGNIRELQNVIERGVVRTTGRVLSRHTTACLATADAQPGCCPVVSLPAAGPVSIRTLVDAERAYHCGFARNEGAGWRIARSSCSPRGPEDDVNGENAEARDIESAKSISGVDSGTRPSAARTLDYSRRRLSY